MTLRVRGCEGCFNVNISPRAAIIVGFKTVLRFILDQQFEQAFLLQICTLFGSGHVTLRSGTNKVYRLTIDSFQAAISTIIDYFTRFPLKTHKRDSFER